MPAKLSCLMLIFERGRGLILHRQLVLEPVQPGSQLRMGLRGVLLLVAHMRS